MSKLDSVHRNLSINSKENILLSESDEENEDRYVVCDNCDEKIDCWNNNIFCLYKGKYKSPTEEITVCQICNDELIEEFKGEGYKCDDWEDEE